MFRLEKKYVMAKRGKIILDNTLRFLLDNDMYGDGQYNVRSLYFDDYSNNSYYDVIRDANERKKYRIRVYDSKDDRIFLEEKKKIQDRIYKTRVIITRAEFDLILSSNYEFLKERTEMERRFYILLRTKLLRPKIIVEYDRRAFVYRNSDVRITIDSNIKAYRFDGTLFGSLYDGNYIDSTNPNVLEVKYHDYIPGFIPDVLARINVLKTNFSKYCLSFEELTGNRFINWR